MSTMSTLLRLKIDNTYGDMVGVNGNALIEWTCYLNEGSVACMSKRTKHAQTVTIAPFRVGPTRTHSFFEVFGLLNDCVRYFTWLTLDNLVRNVK